MSCVWVTCTVSLMAASAIGCDQGVNDRHILVSQHKSQRDSNWKKSLLIRRCFPACVSIFAHWCPQLFPPTKQRQCQREAAPADCLVRGGEHSRPVCAGNCSSLQGLPLLSWRFRPWLPLHRWGASCYCTAAFASRQKCPIYTETGCIWMSCCLSPLWVCCSTSCTPCARTTLPWQQVEVNQTGDHPADVLGSEADQRGLWDLPDGWGAWRCHPASWVNVHVIFVSFSLFVCFVKGC